MSTSADQPHSSFSHSWLSGLAAFAVWLLSRSLMLVLWSHTETFIAADVVYYAHQLAEHGISHGLVEYPTPVVVLVAAAYEIAGHSTSTFLPVFAYAMAALDGLATIALWHWHSRKASAYWALYTFLIGSLIWFRIDLLPAIAVLVSLIFLTRRPRISGAAIAFGAALKLWPALLVIPMLGTDSHGKKRGFGFLVSGGLLGIGSLLLFGWNRSISPVTWQSERGLQIESVMATAPMLGHAFGSVDQYHTELSPFNAWEITGPGVNFCISLADWLLPATVVLALVLGWLIALGGAGLPGHRLENANDPDRSLARNQAILLAQVALISTTIVTNKTFSPQYIIWLAGPLAALLVMPQGRFGRITGRILAALGLICALLTHLIFPLNYGGLIASKAAPANTLLLAGRNLIMVVLCLVSIAAAMKTAWSVGQSRATPAENYLE